MAFLGLFRAVKREFGEARLAQVLDRASDTTRLMSSERIRHFRWYPYAGFSGFLDCVESTFGQGDGSLSRELGKEAAARDLEDHLDKLAEASPEDLIKASAMVWDGYYRNAGYMHAISWAPEETVLRISEFSEMTPNHCKLMEGWMIAAMDAIGIIVHDDARERECMSRGGRWHEFWCRWSPKDAAPT